MIQQSPTTESHIAPLPAAEKRESFHHCPTFQRRNRFHLKDSGVAVEPVCPRFFTRACPALFPPPHFGTLSKIQKGGEPVPQPGEAMTPWSLSVTDETETPHMSACVLCCVFVHASVRTYVTCLELAVQSQRCVHLSCLKVGSH